MIRRIDRRSFLKESSGAALGATAVTLLGPSRAEAVGANGFLKSASYFDFCDGAMGGSVQANMNARVIVAAEMVIPPANVRKAFLDLVLPVRHRIGPNIRESGTLAAIRDTLLPKLISGEIRVKKMSAGFVARTCSDSKGE